MADAEVIPIGAKATAGRGSRTSPSAAARALAPAARRAPAPTHPSADDVDPVEQSPDAFVATPAAGPGAGPVLPEGTTTTRRAVPTAAKPRPTTTRGAAKRSAAGDAASAQARRAAPAHADGPVRRRRAAPAVAVPDREPSWGPEPADSDALLGGFPDDTGDLATESDLERRVAELLAFVRRRITGDYEVDEFGFDREITERVLLTALRPMARRWFRIDARGTENIPAEGGALLVSNHSGTLPLDGLMTSLVVHDATGRSLRSLGADLVFKTPFVGEFARKGGATLACTEDAERMLSGGELVGVWPEGFKGLGKPFSERYKLQRFGRGGFVSAALRTRVPIIPCSVVGAEEIYPMVGNLPTLARLLGLPYLPVTPFFPWLGLLGLIPLPSKWLVEFGEPIRTDQLGDGAADDPMLVFNVTDQVRETIQQTLYSLLMQRRGVFS